MPPLSEAQFQRQVLNYARACGWLIHHSRPAANRRGRYSTPISGDAGLPDLTLARGGRLLFIELKVGRNTLSDAQRAWAAAIAGVDPAAIEPGVRYSCPAADSGPGWISYVWVYPSDWPLLEELLMRRYPRLADARGA